jgi:hypothetical protein
MHGHSVKGIRAALIPVMNFQSFFVIFQCQLGWKDWSLSIAASDCILDECFARTHAGRLGSTHCALAACRRGFLNIYLTAHGP